MLHLNADGKVQQATATLQSMTLTLSKHCKIDFLLFTTCVHGGLQMNLTASVLKQDQTLTSTVCDG